MLGYYVREQHVLTLEDAVRKMSSLPAQILNLRDRGQLREGFAADVAVFDPATVAETNSFDNTKSYAKGVQYVLVNGVPVGGVDLPPHGVTAGDAGARGGVVAQRAVEAEPGGERAGALAGGVAVRE